MDGDFEIIVVGGGLAGSTAAIALASGGLRVALVAPPSPVSDGRTTALLEPAVGLLSDLGVWARVESRAAALKTMRIIDATGRLFRAPTVSFHAGEAGAQQFGYNIANADLHEALTSAVADRPNITAIAVPATHVEDSGERVSVTLADGRTLGAGLLAGADGRNSLARQAAGIACRNWSYPQAALVLTFGHERSHDFISTELHTESGPFTQVPMPGRRSSLVWVERPEEADRLAGLGKDALNQEVEKRLGSMLGRVEIDSPVQRFPLSGMQAERLGAGRIALVGEAGHVFPPIGAQGLNLGMRDVMELTRHRPDFSSRASVENFVRRYDRARRSDVRSSTMAVDLLNRSLLSGFLPTQIVRAGVLSVLDTLHPLRGLLVQEGLRPGSLLPGLRG